MQDKYMHTINYNHNSTQDFISGIIILYCGVQIIGFLS